MRRQRALDEEKRELDLTIEKRVQGSIAQIQIKARQEADEAARLRVAEKDQTIESMTRTIEELKRKAEQGSQQSQGEVLELELEVLLRGRFPTDLVEPVGKGELGADVVQQVNGSIGQAAGIRPCFFYASTCTTETGTYVVDTFASADTSSDTTDCRKREVIGKADTAARWTPPTSQRTFITYAQENEEFKNSILSLADKLRSDGVDVRIDQYEPHPPQGWPRWMEDQFLHAAKIIVVPSKKYLDRYSQIDGEGSGARFEAAILRSLLQKSGVSFERIAVATLARGDQAYIPDLLHGCSRYALSDDQGYETLYRWLTEQPAVSAPELGTIRRLPPKPRPKASASFQSLCREILPLMNDNYRIFRDFGPNSGADAQGPVRFNLNAWYELRKSKIIPNNQVIRQVIVEHRALIPAEHTAIFEKLISHIDAFEAHVANDQVDYREHQFPIAIVEIVTRAASE